MLQITMKLMHRYKRRRRIRITCTVGTEGAEENDIFNFLDIGMGRFENSELLENFQCANNDNQILNSYYFSSPLLFFRAEIQHNL